MDEEIRKLSHALIGENFLALGYSKAGWGYLTFGWLFRRAAANLSTFDGKPLLAKHCKA
jgi:hypothetical protein